jgi:arylsulfatase A-like enzyme
VARLTSAIDIMPSVLELLGVPPPEGLALHGRSFVPVLEGDAGPGRELVVTTMPLTNPGEDVRVVDSVLRRVTAFQPATLSTRERSLLYAARGEPVELYHLPSDPRQETNVAERHPGVVHDLPWLRGAAAVLLLHQAHHFPGGLTGPRARAGRWRRWAPSGRGTARRGR